LHLYPNVPPELIFARYLAGTKKQVHPQASSTSALEEM